MRQRVAPGRKRPNNEDHFAVDESRGIIVLADGMGGHRSGEVASEMATRLLMDKLRCSAIPNRQKKKNTRVARWHQTRN